MTCPPDPLQAFRHGFRRADLDHEVDVTDVYPEFERCGGHDRVQCATPELVLDLESRVPAEAAMVRPDPLQPPLPELVYDALGPAPRVGEHQRGLVFVDHLFEMVVHLRVHDLERESGHVLGRTEHLQVEGALSEDLDDLDVPWSAALEAREELGHILERGDRGRETDPDEIPATDATEALQRDRKGHAPLRVAYLVDLVQDHILDLLELLAEHWRAQHERERFWRCDEYVRRGTQLPLPLGWQRVPCPHGDPDSGGLRAPPLELSRYLPERPEQVLVDVVRQRLERGDVDRVYPVLQLTSLIQEDEFVEY